MSDHIGYLMVPRKLMAEAHAVMREAGWHLATNVENGQDPILCLAATEIERAFADLLGFRCECPDCAPQPRPEGKGR